MVSAINAISTGYYTAMANNSAMNMFNMANSRSSLISSLGSGGVSFGSLAQLSALDTQYELDMLTNSLQYKMAKAMLEELKKQRKENSKRFDIFA